MMKELETLGIEIDTYHGESDYSDIVVTCFLGDMDITDSVIAHYTKTRFDEMVEEIIQDKREGAADALYDTMKDNEMLSRDGL